MKKIISHRLLAELEKSVYYFSRRVVKAKNEEEKTHFTLKAQTASKERDEVNSVLFDVKNKPLFNLSNTEASKWKDFWFGRGFVLTAEFLELSDQKLGEVEVGILLKTRKDFANFLNGLTFFRENYFTITVESKGGWFNALFCGQLNKVYTRKIITNKSSALFFSECNIEFPNYNTIRDSYNWVVVRKSQNGSFLTISLLTDKGKEIFEKLI